LVDGQFIAKQELREIEHEHDRLANLIALHDRALTEARLRLSEGGRDVEQVMKELGLDGSNYLAHKNILAYKNVRLLPKVGDSQS
jgi:hypothetical protein